MGSRGWQTSRSKYGARRTVVDNVAFASKKEAAQYGELKYRLRIGEIRDLELQPKYPLLVNGEVIAHYFADFRFFDVQAGQTIILDVKGCKTPVYRLKKKLVKAIYGIEIQET